MSRNELDMSAEVEWPRFDNLEFAGQVTVLSYKGLCYHGVWADEILLLAQSRRVPLELLTHAAQLLSHTHDQLNLAEDGKGGIDAQTGQDRIDAMARIMMRSATYDRGN